MDRQDFENKLIDWLDRPESPDDLTSDPEERHALRAWRHTSEQIRSRLQQHEPPAALDQKILRAARQQAAQYASPSTRSWLSFLQHWQPIATFATLTLVVGMTFLLSQKTLFEQESAAPSLSVRDVAPAAPQTGQRAAHSPMPAQAPSADKDANRQFAKEKALPSAPQNGLSSKASKVTGIANPNPSDDAVGTRSPRYAPPPPSEEKKQQPSASPTTPTAQKNTRSVGDFFRRLFSSKRKAKAKDDAPSSFAEGRNTPTKTPQPTVPTTAMPSPVLAIAPPKAVEPSKGPDSSAKKEEAENKHAGDADLPSPRMESPPPQRGSASESSPAEPSRSRRGRAIRRYRALTLRRRSRTRNKARKARERKGYGYTGSKSEPVQQDTLPLSEPVSPEPVVRQQYKQRARPARRLPRPAKRRPLKKRTVKLHQPERRRTANPEWAPLFGGNGRPSAPPPPPPSGGSPPSVPKKPMAMSRAEASELQKRKPPQPTSPTVRAPLPAPRVATNEPSPQPNRDPAPPRQQPMTRDLAPPRQDSANTSDNSEKSVLANKWPASKKQQLARLYHLLQNNQTPQAIALVQQILAEIMPTQREELRRALLDFAQKNRYTAFFQQLSALPQP